MSCNARLNQPSKLSAPARSIIEVFCTAARNGLIQPVCYSEDWADSAALINVYNQSLPSADHPLTLFSRWRCSQYGFVIPLGIPVLGSIFRDRAARGFPPLCNSWNMMPDCTSFTTVRRTSTRRCVLKRFIRSNISLITGFTIERHATRNRKNVESLFLSIECGKNSHTNLATLE